MFALIEMLPTIAKTTRKFIGKLMKCLKCLVPCASCLVRYVCAPCRCQRLLNNFPSKVAYTSVRNCHAPLSTIPLTYCKFYALHAACNLAALICKLSCCAKRRAGKQVLGCSFCRSLVPSWSHYPSLLPLPWRQ